MSFRFYSFHPPPPLFPLSKILFKPLIFCKCIIKGYRDPINLPKNIFQKLHFSEKHQNETILARMYISLNVHLPEIKFHQKLIFQKLHYPESHLAEITLARIYIWPKLHFPKCLISRIYTCQNLHLVKIIFPRKLFSRICT